jgi:hypothetical protein
MPGYSCASEASIADWLQILRVDNGEIPGLTLTRQQVWRLWGQATAFCDAPVPVGTFVSTAKRGDRRP